MLNISYCRICFDRFCPLKKTLEFYNLNEKNSLTQYSQTFTFISLFSYPNYMVKRYSGDGNWTPGNSRE